MYSIVFRLRPDYNPSTFIALQCHCSPIVHSILHGFNYLADWSVFFCHGILTLCSQRGRRRGFVFQILIVLVPFSCNYVDIINQIHILFKGWVEVYCISRLYDLIHGYRQILWHSFLHRPMTVSLKYFTPNFFSPQFYSQCVIFLVYNVSPIRMSLLCCG